MKEKTEKPWSGRFEQGTHPDVERFTSSLDFDKRLYPFDIQGSIAHARMLGFVGLITKRESEELIRGLKEIREELDNGQFPFNPSLEDIHMNIESRLIQKLGPAGGKLHTARSRNDQVALDMRLYIMNELNGILDQLRSLQEAILNRARDHIQTLMPGYTHLQRAQPVVFAHHLMAYFEMFKRDRERFGDCLRRVRIMPLGSGALSGTTLPIDRESVARELGFDSISENSLDAVSDRDYILEFLSASSILMMHLSRFAEEIILWTTTEFGFIELPDSLCTGSSLMPQKKNPDLIELVRGKTGRVYGHLMSLLVTMKGLPLSYNRDMQEDKEPLFDTVDTLKGALSIIKLCVEKMSLAEDRMRAALDTGFLEATDLAEYLVKKGVPFREAHHIVGRVVLEALNKGCRNLSSFTVDDLKVYSEHFDEDVVSYLEPDDAAARKDIPGGTSPLKVKEAIGRAEEYLKSL
ncbi:MAG: argininosuccinate lyase [bacterium]